MYSLRWRLLIIASVILVFFFMLMTLILENAFKRSIVTMEHARLEAVIQDLTLLVQPLPQHNDLIIDTEIDHRLKMPLSGLYAQVTKDNGSLMWRSPSMMGDSLSFVTRVDSGKKLFYDILYKNKQKLFALSYKYLIKDGHEIIPLVLSVAEDRVYFEQHLSEFTMALVDLSVSFIFLLVLILFLMLNWGFYPIKKLTKEIKLVEKGEIQYLSNLYPRELIFLKDNINHFISYEERRRARYSNAISDMAHSMKTPLAVLNNLKLYQPIQGKDQNILDEQVDRLQQIVRYQLQRANTLGASLFQKPVLINKVIDQVLQALEKVYFEKKVIVHNLIPEADLFYGDELDLLEILGNCLDNAFKWCDNTVWIKNDIINQYNLVIEDNGPGFSVEMMGAYKQRGIRADEKRPGQGLGLAIVNDIVEIYGGELLVLNNNQGAKVMVRLSKVKCSGS